MVACESGIRPRRWKERAAGAEDLSGSCKSLAAIVAAAMQVDVPDLFGPERGTAATASARAVSMYLAHVVLAMSYSEIGRHFGRDRTTVSHACARVEDARERPEFETFIGRLETALDQCRSRILTRQS